MTYLTFCKDHTSFQTYKSIAEHKNSAITCSLRYFLKDHNKKKPNYSFKKVSEQT